MLAQMIAIGYMRWKMNGWKTRVLKGRFIHMRCVAHIVNLVVSNGLKTVNESVQRVRHAVRFIKQSSARLQRWNSTYLMLNVAIELEDAFKRFYEFLQAFYGLTLHVSGSLYDTSNLFFHELVSVVVLLKYLVSSDDPDMCLMACKMKEKFEKYWGDPEKMNLLIFIAVVLGPRYNKLDYVEWMITEIYDPIVASKLVNNVKEALNALYEEYLVSSSNDVNREEVSSSKDDKTPSSTKHKKIEVLKNKYKKHKFPTAERITRDVVDVPVTTVAYESAFNTSGRVLDQFRSSLTPRVVEGPVCAQNWLRASPFPCIEECLVEVELLEEVSIFGPALYWKVNKGTKLGHHTSSNCPPCICDCPPPLSILKIVPDCGKSDPELQQEMEKQYAELLMEELKLQEVVAQEHIRHMNATYREARRVASQYQREAEKCTIAIETCEEARENAEALILREMKLALLWQQRAHKMGWQGE
uniref:Uncharacterized protein n=1 Tax=Chenopodium quinoa TaxID=63459 RepID=A0A803MBZ5_CHEQI